MSEPPGALAKRDQVESDEIASVTHDAKITAIRYRGLVDGGVPSAEAFTLTRDWHAACFCGGETCDDGNEFEQA